MFNLRLGKTFYWGEVFGATIAAPIWKRIMDRASAGMPLRDFAEPGGKVQSGDFVSIPRVYGLSLSNAMGLLTSAGFRPVVGYAVNSSIPAGLAVGTQPAYRALRGSAVVIYTSNGVAKPTPPPTPTKTKADRPPQKR
jgi:hypothetical protein